MLYGEGKKAFQRLQLEIIRISSDQSVFAWNPRIPRSGSVLAEDPSDFRGCGYIKKVEPDEYGDRLTAYIELERLGHPWHNQRNFWKIATDLIHPCRLAWLRWRARTLSQQLRTFTVSNAGIQVCLPVILLPDSPSHCRAILACGYGQSLITIDLVSSGASFDRIPRIHTIPKTYPELKTFCLAHHQDANEKCRQFILDDKHASHYGFGRYATYPREFSGDAVTLSSLTGDLTVVVYANSDAGSYFAVGLGYHLGQAWVHVGYDRGFPTEEENRTNFGRRAYHRMWKARAKHARDLAEHRPQAPHYGNCSVKHVHLPRSIWAAKVVWGVWGDDFKVMVDVVDCPGCCDGPYRMTTTLNDPSGLDMPGLMKMVSCSYQLELDKEVTQFDDCSGHQCALGDYGDYSHGNLVRTGNIFEDMRAAGTDREHSIDFSTVFRISSPRLMAWMLNEDDVVFAYVDSSKRYLALHQPRAFSLPANERVSLLLKVSSARLAGKHLVTAIVRCSDFYMVDEDGKRTNSGDDSAPANGNHSTEARILTPLCIITSPQVWRRELRYERRMERFRSIREHFGAMVDAVHYFTTLGHRHTGNEQFDKSASKQKEDAAIEFFLDLFGLKYLENYIGKITFFVRFPSTMETSAVDVQSAGAVEVDGLRARLLKLSCASSLMGYNPFRGSRQFTAAESDPRLQTVLPLLHRRCQTLCAQVDAPRRYAHERRRIEGETKSISQTLGADLFAHIRTAFISAYFKLEL
ncbi:hypothetical protein PISMIDRAFT_13326 [Pisolithus microcarpus 441]|uniref:Uncharacterized protein n=2 Tax=Pisolithus microcarpus 441 TaxID=765257 RepID=A0A0C9YTK3_9AGAM|nr:hypothetical protein PISMIDRAFT_13326 [Pisolithus microcarpus 441]